MKVSVLCFDVSGNAAGRADLLARLLEPLGAVEVIGPRSEPGVWKPAAAGPIRYTSLPTRRMPGFFATMTDLARRADGDLIYASKTRLGSAGVGYLKRVAGKRRLLLDIDDWELGFYVRSGFWGTVGRAVNIGNPNGLPWTWLCERLTRLADGVTVASRFLQQRFGGTLIPHVRDTDAWKPGAADAAKGRRRLGLEGKRVVMFLGTPRDYKGLDDLAAAMASIGRADVSLAVVGAESESAAGRRILERCPGATLVPWVPFDQVPALLSAADVVAVPQRQTSDTVGQVPAKIFDAMALGRPIVSTRVSMIPEILEGCGLLVEPGDVEGLASAIRRLLDAPAEAESLGARARERCVERYSFRAARRDLFPLIERVMAKPAATPTARSKASS
jgi:glycosyltransferase involved in cell wall biosynthesis